MGLFNLLRKPGNQSNASRAVQPRGSAASLGSSGGATAPSSAAAVGGDSLRTSCSSTGSEELRPPVKRSSSFNRRADGLRSRGCSAGGSGAGPGAAPAAPLRRGAIEVAAPCAGGAMGAAAAPDRCMRLPAAGAGAMERRRGDAAGAALEALFADVALIHRGRNALIYRARDPDSRRPVILKAYDPRKGQSADREVAVLRDAGPHPGLIRLEGVVEVPAAPTTLVLEAAGGGTLIEAMANNGGRLPERVAARRVVAPLLRALAHLHSRGIVHRDLKPEHVLLAPDGPRITDFAAAAYLPRPPAADEGGATARPRRVSVGGGHGPRSELLNHRIGGAAVEYMAPEVLGFPTASEVFHLVIASGMDEEDLPTHDEKVDVWSLGVLTYEALTGRQPFLADGAAEMASVVAQRLAARADAASEAGGGGGGSGGGAQPAFIARTPGLSQDARDFLTRCLQASPAARPAAADLLQHPWLARRTSLDAITAARRASLDAAAAARRGSLDAAAAGSSGSGGSSAGGGAVKRTSAAAGLGCPAAAAAAASPRHSLSAAGSSSEGLGGPPHLRRASLAQRDSSSGSGDGRGGGGGGPAAAEAARAEAMVSSLHRSVSAADTREVHLTMRSATGRLEGALPGRRASAAANLAGGRSSDGS